MTRERELLKKSVLFQDLGYEAVDIFLQRAEQRTYSAGEIMHVEMAEDDEIAMILEGDVRVERALANADQPMELMRAGEGEFIGLFHLFGEGPYSGTVTAVTAVEVLVWRATMWREIFEGDYEIGYRIVQAAAAEFLKRANRWALDMFDHVSWGLD